MPVANTVEKPHVSFSEGDRAAYVLRNNTVLSSFLAPIKPHHASCIKMLLDLFLSRKKETAQYSGTQFFLISPDGIY